MVLMFVVCGWWEEAVVGVCLDTYSVHSTQPTLQLIIFFTFCYLQSTYSTLFNFTFSHSNLLPLFATGLLSVVCNFIAFAKIWACHFLVFSCLNGNSFISCFTWNFLSLQNSIAVLNTKSAPSFFSSPPDSQISNTLSSLERYVWVVRWLLLCHLRCWFCHLFVVVVFAAVVVIFVIVIFVVAIIVVVVAIVLLSCHH